MAEESSGVCALKGFRNRDIRERLHPSPHSKAEQKRQSGKISHLLRFFREHGLILNLKGAHSYQLTAEGRRILPELFRASGHHRKTQPTRSIICALCAKIDRLQCRESREPLRSSFRCCKFRSYLLAVVHLDHTTLNATKVLGP